jgi:hypothetical protein
MEQANGEQRWCSYERIWFSGPDKQDMFILGEERIDAEQVLFWR